VDVTVEEQPVYGRGRPSAHTPRTVTAMRYRRKTTLRPHSERISRREEEAGCFVLLTNVPTAGTLAHSARDKPRHDLLYTSASLRRLAFLQ
jgi:hypothetical protein